MREPQPLGGSPHLAGRFPVLASAVLAKQRHEHHAAEVLLPELVLAGTGHPQKPLILVPADGDYQAAAELELAAQGVRDRRPAGRDEDGVEGRGLEPAACAVSASLA